MVRRGKFFITLLGVTILVAGVFIGAFLVLRSETSQGQFFTIDNEGVAYLKTQTTQALLNELAALRTGGRTTTDTNLTQQFLDVVEQEISANNLTEAEIMSDDFFASVVLSYLETNGSAIFPRISDTEINISALADSRKYLDEVSVHLLALAGAWQKIIQQEDRDVFTGLSALLKEGESALRAQVVPTKYLEFHKRVLQLSFAIRTVIENSILRSGNDPLLGLIAVAQLGEIQTFGQRVIEEFIRLESVL